MDQLDLHVQEIKLEVKKTNGIMIRLLIAIVVGVLIYAAQTLIDLATRASV